MPFSFTPLHIPGVVRIEARAFEDGRGYFLETYRRSAFAAQGLPGEFVQENCSYSTGGVLRGLHYQRHPAAQAKLVRVVRGAVLDVAVDVRRGSPTFGRWVAEELSEANHRMLLVPVGCAHGFLTLSAQAHLVYQVSAEYAPEHEGGIRWDDPDLAIAWPAGQPRLSPRDAALPALAAADLNFVWGEG